MDIYLSIFQKQFADLVPEHKDIVGIADGQMGSKSKAALELIQKALDNLGITPQEGWDGYLERGGVQWLTYQMENPEIAGELKIELQDAIQQKYGTSVNIPLTLFQARFAELIPEHKDIVGKADGQMGDKSRRALELMQKALQNMGISPREGWDGYLERGGVEWLTYQMENPEIADKLKRELENVIEETIAGKRTSLNDDQKSGLSGAFASNTDVAILDSPPEVQAPETSTGDQKYDEWTLG